MALGFMVLKKGMIVVLRKCLVVFTLLLIFAGCATTISLKVQRVPTMNTAGVRRIAIMPFKTSDNSSLQNEIARFLTVTATSKIRGTNYFIIVDSYEIERLQKSGENIGNHVDALFTGQILSMTTIDSSHVIERTDPETKNKVYETVYDREVSLSFNYSFTRSRDGTIIDVITRQGKATDHKDDRNRLNSPSQMGQGIANSRLSNLARDVAPYTATESRSLLNEKTKDKELKIKMKDAVTLVKGGNYKGALNAYLTIYDFYNNFAAAHNAAIMHEALGDTSAAADLMEKVINETGNPQAYTVLTRLNKNLQEQAMLANEYSDTREQKNKVADFAISEIQKVLPIGAKVWVFNNSKEEKDLASTITDEIIAGLLKDRVVVVDRRSSRLIQAEQTFQMSGNVSDDDFVSVSNAVGANTLAIVAITGVSSLRRLQLRVVDIETRTNLLQSDTSDNWKL
jgi:TolB-like protein